MGPRVEENIVASGKQVRKRAAQARYKELGRVSQGSARRVCVCVCSGGSPGLAKGRDGRILGVFRGQSRGHWVEVKRQWVSGLRFPL